MIQLISRSLLGAAVLLALACLALQRGSERAVSAQQAQVAVLNAASFNPDLRVAPDSIAAAFGQFVTQGNQIYNATSLPLPTTLGGVRLTVGGVAAGLFFVAPTQINFVVPAGLADAAAAAVVVTNSDNSTRTGNAPIVRSAAGIFTARSNGMGVAAAQTTTDGAVYLSVFNPDLSERDVNAGTVQQPNFLVLYTTGIRRVPATNPNDANGVAESVRVTLQGVPLRVDFAGPTGLAGLDQINAKLPPEAAGLGRVDIQVSTTNPNVTNPQLSNKANIKMGGQLPDIRVQALAADETRDGELTADDQIQMLNDGSGRTFFFDAYRFTTTQANTTVAIDMRTRGTTTLDPAIILYRVSSGNLVQVGEDDQSGGYGNGRVENNNSLLLSVLPTPGDYVIFATSANEQPNGIGAYSLRMRQNVLQQVNYGANITNAGIANTDIQTSAGTYLDAYWFTAAANDNAEIRMGSTAFDSFLILQLNEGGTPIASNDNANSSTRDSLITRRLTNAGIYIALCTPYEPNRTGAYTFALNRLSSLNEASLAEAEAAPQRRLSELRGSLTGRLVIRRIEE
jgi:uncharacterized protein (TIGR03437 family)